MLHLISVLAAVLPHNQTPAARQRIREDRAARLAARTNGRHHNDSTHWSGHRRLSMKAVKQDIEPDYTKTQVVPAPRIPAAAAARARRPRPERLTATGAQRWQDANQIHDTLTHPHVYVFEAARA